MNDEAEGLKYEFHDGLEETRTPSPANHLLGLLLVRRGVEEVLDVS